MFCTKCGQKNPDNYKFCSRCGNPLKQPVIVEEAGVTETKKDEVKFKGQAEAQSESLSSQDLIKEDSSSTEKSALEDEPKSPLNQYDEDGNLILPVYDEPKKGKLGIILGIISAIIITAGGIVSYHYYIESVSFLSPYMISKKENNLAKLVTKSDIVSLNDISYVTYSIETILPTLGESLIAEVPVNYSVDWPVSGPDHLVEKIKAWITEQVTTLEGEEIIPIDTSIEKMLIDRFNNLKEQMVLEEGYYEGPAKDEKLVSIAQNGKVINLSGYEDRPNVRQNSWSGISISEILTVSGKTFSYEFLPDFETIKPLLVKFLLANDEPIGYEYGDVVEALHYPEKNPKFTETGLSFNWGIYETVSPYTIFSSEIPYYDIIPFLNADALEFVPESEIQKFKNAKSNLTENLILELAERGITYPNNPNLSKEFQAIVTLGCLLPNDYPGGIGANETLMSYWYSGQDGGEDDGFVKAEIISQNEDKAKTKIYYREWGTLHPHSMDLIKEKQILPSGLEIHHWVIDDFDGKKSIVLERLNDQAIEFKNGYGQRLMEDPDESGFMSQSEKDEYIEKVNIFLQEYSNFQSN